MHRLFPFILWLPQLRRREVWRRDLVAGITIAAVIIPQSMAVARLAGLPAEYGLYAAFIPPVIAALWGSSRHLVTGPVALTSLISAATVGSLAAADSDNFVAYSILLALMVGVIRLAMGVLRLGALVDFLSAPVVVGFTNAAALIIATSLLYHVVGVPAEREGYHYLTVANLATAAAAGVHWQTVGMAALAAAILVGLRRRYGKVLVAVAATTLCSWALGFDGEVVGDIPRGLPSVQLPRIDFAIVPQLLMGAAVLTLIGLMEAMSIAKTIATKSKQHIDVNQELIGQGMANLVGSLFQSYAVSGSFSRSAINYDTGGATGFSSVVCSLVVMVTLLFLTPLLYYLPQATLAAIIILAVLSLIRVKPLLVAWRVSPMDGATAVVTFVVTLLFAPQLHIGILTGVLLSIGQYLFRTMRPHVAYLARHPDGALVDADAHGLALDQRIAIIRFDGRLYFGASSFFEDKVLEAVSRLPDLRYIIIDAGGINRVDATGEQTLRRVVEDLRAIDVDVYFTRAKQQFVEVLERSGAIDYIGRDHFFDWNQHALEHLWDQMEPAYRARCPLNVPTPQAQSGSWMI